MRADRGSNSVPCPEIPARRLNAGPPVQRRDLPSRIYRPIFHHRLGRKEAAVVSQPCRFLFLLLVMAIAGSTLSAQVTTGKPPFSSSMNGPVDTIDLANLNAHFTIPVLHKNGRGMPFAYDLSYDNSIWQPVTSNGVQSWQNLTDTTWGWTTSIPRAGHVSYSTSISMQTCYVGRIQEEEITTTYSNWRYYDGRGTPHPKIG